MPKKTRKQKLEADKRHTRTLPLSVEQPSSSPVQSGSTFQFQVAVSSTLQKRQVEAGEELLAIRQDITKTVVLAIIAVGIELALYWRWYK